MRLVYVNTQKPVSVGDDVMLRDGRLWTVAYFREPPHARSGGKVSVRPKGSDHPLDTVEYYVSVIGAEWIEREDQPGLHMNARQFLDALEEWKGGTLSDDQQRVGAQLFAKYAGTPPTK